MKKLVTLFMLVLACVLSISAQNSSPRAGDVPEQQKQLDALKGTYALQNLNPRVVSSAPSDLAVIIERNRKENEENRLQLNENLVLIIYSRNKVSNSALPEKRD